MRTLNYVISFLLLYFAGLLAFPGQTMNKFAAPGRFCTGMTFDGQYLWVADYKADRLFKIDPQTGKKLAEIPSPGFWPLGLAWDGHALWCGDGKQKKLFQVDAQNGTILKTIDAPSSSPDGLAWDGHTLWVCDSQEKQIMKIDMNDGTAVQSFAAPASSPQGLTFDGAYLWCSDRMTDELYMIDPGNGEVIIVLKSPGPYPRGLAWDGQNLLNVDYQNDEVYRLVRQDQETYKLSNPRSCSVTFTHEAKIYGQGKLRSLDVYIAIPEEKPQQKITGIQFSPKDRKSVKDHWGQPIAHFQYRNEPAESRLQSVMTVQTTISDIRYFIFPDRCGTLADIPKEIRDLYTTNGSKYLLDDPYIQDLAKKIVGEEKNPYWIARKIFDYVRLNVEYKLEGGWNVAPVVLKRRTGSCSEYTFSFIALCRAAGLPARYVGSIVVRGDDASLDDVFHRWPEVYLPNYGWIPMDPQGGDKATPRERALNIGNLPNRFLITTQGGGDSEYLGWYYNSNETWQSDPQVKVEIEAFGEWEPVATKK